MHCRCSSTRVVDVDLTPAELTLLGLLAERPRHGYEIEKTIEERGMRRWTDLAFSSIYYVIKKLEKAALIEAVVHPGAAPTRSRRTTYAPTSAGFTAAREATRAALAAVSPAHPVVLVGLANLPLLVPGQASAALRSRADELAQELRRLTADPRSSGVAPPFVTAIFDHALTSLRAELDWTSRTTAFLEAGAPGEEDGEDVDGQDRPAS